MTLRSATALASLGVAALLAVPGADAVDDPTPPVVTFNIVGTKGANGWYTSNVTVSWSFSDPESGIMSSSPPGCNATTLVNDTQGAPISCSATNLAGVTSTVSLTIRIDKTAPAVTSASPDRAPDSAGWYTRPVRVAFGGVDGTSGVEACSVMTYGGPDAGGASVSGNCHDRAGNQSGQMSFALNYDATAPGLSGVTVQASSHSATVRWKPLPPWEIVTVRRSPGDRIVFQGSGSSFTDRTVLNGVLYVYVVVASDPAGNSDAESLKAAPKGPLRAPAEKARVSSPPTLRWVKVRKASFYNVQVFRNGRKILSRWPVREQLRLRRKWVWNGRKRTLVPGTYRWFVWPAYRKRGGGIRYGKSLGFSDFVVPRGKRM
jgi:hypothetical protein